MKLLKLIKKNTLTFILTIAIIILSITSVCAYYVQRHYGWEQSLSIPIVSFTFNDKYMGEKLTGEDLTIEKGSSVFVDLSLKTYVSTKIATRAQYEIDFEVDSLDNVINKALVFYINIDGEYEKIGNIDDLNDYVIDDEMNVEVGSDKLVTSTHTLKIECPNTSSTNLSDVNFKITAKANAFLEQDGRKIFVKNTKDLNDAITKVNSLDALQTIVLLNDIKLNNDLVFDKSIGIDLNGYTLDNFSYYITINTSENLGKALKIYDSNTLKTGSILGNINLNCTNDIILVEDKFSSNITVSNINQTVFNKVLEQNVSEIFKNTYEANENINLFKNLKTYINSIDATGLKGFNVEDLDLVFPYDLEDTALISGLVTYVLKDNNQGYKTLSIRIKGTNLASSAKNALDNIPDVISSSIYLPTYDPYTKANLQWYSSDESLISNSGKILPNGIKDLESFENQKVKLIVVASSGGVSSSAKKEVTIQVINNDEIIDLIYNNSLLYLSSIDNTINFMNNKIDLTYLSRSGLTSALVSIVDESQNKNSKDEDLVEILSENFINDGKTYQTSLINLINVPDNDNTVIDILVTFTFNDGSSISVDNQLKIVNQFGSGQLEDVGDDIKSQLDNNDYVEGKSFDFVVEAMTESGTFIEYFCDCDYIMIENGLFIDGKYYSKIHVLPNKTPKNDTEEIISAKLYTLGIENNKVYLQDDNGVELQYDIPLKIYGILKEGIDITDSDVYNILKSYYDLNNNGYIENYESKTKWFDGNSYLLNNTLSQTSNISSLNKTYNYIDFKGYDITSITGLEEFIYIEGLDISYNQLINIDSLRKMYQLSYLNADTNKINDLFALEYLDNLEYINLSNNKLTSIKSLKYLENVLWLNLVNNPNLSDISPLENYNNIKYLDLRDNLVELNNRYNQYFAANLINNNDGLLIYFNNDSYTPTAIDKAASKILKDVVTVENVYTSLNLVKYVMVDNVRYDLTWSVIGNQDSDFIEIHEDGSYTITSPIINREINLQVVATNSYNETSTLARKIFINLLSEDKDIYVEQSDGTFINIDNVTDITLRSILYYLFQNPSDITETIINGTTYGAEYVISQNELSVCKNLDLRGKDVSSLEGLGIFSAGFNNKDLYLQQYILTDSDFEELKLLTSVRSIVLGGAEYDFTNLLDYNDATKTYTSNFTQLKNLIVYDCYSLDNKDVLRSLYINYITIKTLNIYIENDGIIENNVIVDGKTPWNPYEDTLTWALMSLPSILYFDTINDTRYLPNNTPVEFYEYLNIEFSMSGDLKFRYLDNDFDSIINNTSKIYTYDSTAHTLTLNKMVHGEYLEYVLFEIIGNDGRSNIVYNHNIMLVANYEKNILVETNEETLPLEQIFSGETLREAVLNKLNETVFNDDSKYSYDSTNNIYTVSISTISELEITSIGVSTNPTQWINGRTNEYGHALSGLRYLPKCTKVWVGSDFEVGDGLDLIHLEELRVTGSMVDFSTLETELNGLKKLYLGYLDYTVDGKYVAKYSSYTVTGNTYVNFNNVDGTSALLKLPNLTDLMLVNCKLDNYKPLRSAYDVRNDLQKLYIYNTNNNTYTNMNNVHINTVEIISSILNASSYKDDFGVSATDFRIGDYELSGSNVDEAYKYKFENTTTNDSSPQLNPQIEDEYSVIKDYIVDAGLKIGSDYYFDLRNDTVTSGTTIILPNSINEYFYSHDYAVDFDDYRTLQITWRITGMTIAEFEEYFTIKFNDSSNYTLYEQVYNGTTNIEINLNNNNETIGDYVLTVKKNLPNDFYTMIIGSIGHYMFTYDYEDNTTSKQAITNKNIISFIYPVLIKESINKITNPNNGLSYANFLDPALRSYIYTMYQYNQTGIINGVISNTVNNSIDAISIKAYEMKVGNETTKRELEDVAEYSNKNVNKYYHMQKNIISLAGIYNLNLNAIAITNNTVSDISGLAAGSSNNSNLKYLYLDSNFIQDISEIYKLTKLEAVNLYNNNISTIDYNASQTVFKSSGATLSYLNLSYNLAVDGKQILKFSNELTKTENRDFLLSIYKTKAEIDFEIIEACNNIVNNLDGNLGYIYMTTSESKNNNSINNILSTNFTVSTNNTYEVNICRLYDTKDLKLINKNQYTTYYNCFTEINGTGDFIKIINGLSTNFDTRANNWTNSATSGNGNITISVEIDVIGDSFYTGDNFVKMGDLKFSVPFKIASAGTDSPYEPYVYINYEDTSKLTTTLNDKPISDYDPVLALYALSKVKNGTTDSNTNIVNYDYTGNIEIKTAVGIKSLKGAENLSNRITISNNFTLESLFESGVIFDNSRCNLIISDAHLESEDIINAINSLGRKDKDFVLNLAGVYGLDYGSPTDTSSLAYKIATNQYLTEVYMNVNMLNFYDEYNFNNNIKKFLDPNTNPTLFDIDGAQNILTSENLYKFFLPSQLTTSYRNMYVRYDSTMLNAFAINSIETGKTFEHTYIYKNLSCDNYKIQNPLTKMNFFHTIPKTIYQEDIQTTGVNYYLPQSVYYLGKEYDINYENNDELINASYLTSNYVAIAINNSNFDESIINIELSSRLYNGTIFSGNIANYEMDIMTSTMPESSNNDGIYYIEITNDDSTTSIYKATDLINPNLLYALFNYTNASSYLYDYNGGVSNLIKASEVTKLSTAVPISSLKGIQYFTNIDTLSFDDANFSDISYLSNLHLKSFSIYTKNSSYINDFTPLIEGSKDTLQTLYFSNSNKNYKQFTFDFSFILEFTNLTKVGFLNKTDVDEDLVNFIASPQFRYTLTQLYLRNSNARFIISEKVYDQLNDYTPLTYEIKYDSVGKFNYIVPNKEDYFATDILAKYGISSCFEYENSVYGDYINKITSTNKEVALPSYISQGGINYLIKYTSNTQLKFKDGSNNYSNNEAYYTLKVKQSFNITINGESITITNDTRLSYEDLNEIINSKDLVMQLYSNNLEIVSEAKFINTTNANITLTCNINGYDYSRNAYIRLKD